MTMAFIGAVPSEAGRVGGAIADFCVWLAGTPLSLAFQKTDWVVPTVQTVHILAVSIVLSSMVLLDLRLLGVWGRARTVSMIASRSAPWLWSALTVLAFTGIILIITEPARELLNVTFRLKMILLACVVALTIGLRHGLRRDERFWELSDGRLVAGRAVALTSLVLWVSIAVCGRLIAYVGGA